MTDLLNDCPLVTSYTRRFGAPDKTLELLYRVRQHDIDEGPIPIKLPKRLRTHLVTGEPLVLKNFQTQMIAHLIKMPRFLNGEGVGLGKTLDAVVAAAYLQEKYKGTKIIVLGTKSTTYQWMTDGFDKFTAMRTMVMEDSYKKQTGSPARLAQIRDFLQNDNHDVMICKYTSLIGQRKLLEGQFDEEGNPIGGDKRERISQEVRDLVELLKPVGERVILICDECQKFKSTTTQIRNMILNIQPYVGRIWAMTATIIQNNLEEFYSIASAIGIRPFGNMSQFREDFCLYKDVYIGNGRTKPTLKGYKNVKLFKEGMRPFYFGRSQAQVKEPLPILTTMYHPVDLNKRQVALLTDEIPNKKITLPPSVRKIGGEVFAKEKDIDNRMVMLALSQAIINHPGLIDPDNKKDFLTKTLSPKEECLLDLLDGEYAGEHVIIFTKYKRWINRLEYLCSKGWFTDRKFLRITGDENEKQRNANRLLFQNDPNYDCIFINSASIEGANLQSAAHMIVLDLPWSWGQFIQLIGRMVRMSSPHSACILHILLAKGSVDEYTLDTLLKKKGLFEQILGSSHSAGILNSSNDLDLASGMEQVNDDGEFRRLLKAHDKVMKMKEFLSGALIKEAANDVDYVMSFEEDNKKSIKKKHSISDEDLMSRWSF